jgi:hypothetical protein
MKPGLPVSCPQSAAIRPSPCTPPPSRPPPPLPLAWQDVKAAMRNHWDGSSHDPYLHANPDEPWRPIALL